MTDFLLCFLLGGAGYVLIELLWRGRSHFSMFIAGGFLRPAPCPVPTVCPAAAGKVHSRRIGDNRNRIHRGVHSKPAHGAKRMGLFRQAVQSLQTDMPRFRAALGSAFAAHSAAVRSYKIGAFPGALYLYL